MISDQVKYQAKSVDLIQLAEAMGFHVMGNREGKECWLAEHDSLKISPLKNEWYQHASGIGGDTIEFAMHFPNRNQRTFVEAVNFILKVTNTVPLPSSTIKQVAVSKMVESDEREFTLPEKVEEPRRVVAYLTGTRGVDRDIVWENIRNGNLYQSKGSNNCVFVSRDENGNPRSAFMRGTLSDKRFARDCNGSDKSYSFVMKAKGFTDSVFVYESAIDAMSHATISKRFDGTYDTVDRLSLGGVSSLGLERYLKDNPNIKNVVLCLDNDEAGRNATVRIREKLSGQYNLSSYPPKHKDFNEDLLAILKPKRELTI